jgi:hypothetical protein
LRAAETDEACLSGLEQGMRNPSWGSLVRLAKVFQMTEVVPSLVEL